MNQILNKYDNNKSNNYKKEVSIPIFAIIIPLIIISLFIVFSFNIYSKGNDNTVINVEEQERFVENEPNIGEIQKQDNNDVSTEVENIEEEKNEEKNKEKTNENTNSREVLYTADNGETYSIIGRLSIPILNIEYPILSSSSTALLKISLNRYWGAYPNEVGNMVVVGHNYKNNKFFSNLPKIQIGDVVKITDTRGQTLDYSVYDTSVIDPYDNSCTSQLTDGQTEITLITCYYEKGSTHATKRFVAKAKAY